MEDTFGPDRIINIDEGSANIKLAKGAKVMITRNLTVAGAVYNGAVGRVVDIIYEIGNKDQVKCIIVDVKGYDGNVIVQSDEGYGVPVFRMTECANLAKKSTRKSSVSLSYCFIVRPPTKALGCLCQRFQFS